MGWVSVKGLPGNPRLRKKSGLDPHSANPVGRVLEAPEEELKVVSL